MNLQQKLRHYEEEKGIEYVIPTPTEEVSHQLARILSHFKFRWNYSDIIRIDDIQFTKCACIYPSGGFWGEVLPDKDDPDNWAYGVSGVDYKFVTPSQFLRVLKDINARGECT